MLSIINKSTTNNSSCLLIIITIDDDDYGDYEKIFGDFGMQRLLTVQRSITFLC